MARTKRKVRALPTIWRCPDDLWTTVVYPLLMELDPPTTTGRTRTDPRRALDGIIYHLRTGCQWNALPREFGDDSSVHRTMQRWIERDVLLAIWGVLIEQCEELDGVDWDWQSADAAMGKARLGRSHRLESHRSCEKGHQTQRDRGRRRRAAGRRRGRCQHA